MLAPRITTSKDASLESRMLKWGAEKILEMPHYAYAMLMDATPWKGLSELT